MKNNVPYSYVDAIDGRDGLDMNAVHVNPHMKIEDPEDPNLARRHHPARKARHDLQEPLLVLRHLTNKSQQQSAKQSPNAHCAMPLSDAFPQP